MLEDDFNDCISKAIRGHGCPIVSLAKLAGIPERSITDCLQGNENPSAIRSIAPHLQLSAERLLNLKNYRPHTPIVPGLTQVTSPFGHLGVNAYVITSGDLNLIFDTGTDASDLQLLAPDAQHVFITHEHPDHIAELNSFTTAEIHRPAQLQHGDQMRIADLSIHILDVAGHASPAFAYLIKGLEKDVCIVGDAIFAGSIGGCPSTSAYTTALSNIRNHILRLPGDTILCPGHGPMTTVTQELAHNPFFAS